MSPVAARAAKGLLSASQLLVLVGESEEAEEQKE
jgi:hypothetical protein